MENINLSEGQRKGALGTNVLMEFAQEQHHQVVGYPLTKGI